MSLEGLQERVRVLEDLEEIKKMHRAYMFHLSAAQWDEALSYFAENAVVEIRTFGAWKGREEIDAKFRDVIARRYADIRPWGGHILVQPVISVHGNTATGHWIMSRFVYDMASPDRAAQLSRGRYDCEYLKVDGKWKFTYLKLSVPWPEDVYNDLHPVS